METKEIKKKQILLICHVFYGRVDEITVPSKCLLANKDGWGKS